MSEHVRVMDAEGVRSITLDRPVKKNAITHAMYAAMADAIVAGEADPRVRVMLITGVGDTFTAGNDITDFIDAPPTFVEGGDAAPAPVQRFLAAISTMTKPMVAAVNGKAVGVGVTLLLHCDLVYATTDATFVTPFVDLGLTPEAGSSLLLPARVGRAQASEMLLLGEPLSAPEAVDAGLVARLYNRGALLPEARARARRIALKSPTAIRETKRLIAGAHDMVTVRMAEEAAVFTRLLQSDEFREAAVAFLEKRAPDFSRFS